MKINPQSSVVILGLGRSGMAAVRFLHHTGVTVAVSDTRSRDKLAKLDLDFLEKNSIPLETGGHSEKFCTATDYLVPSPGVPLNSEVILSARSKGIPVIGELGIINSYVDTPLIAVTGTNGKTTVTSLIGELLKSSGYKVFVGGNIGTPIFEYLLSQQDEKNRARADVLVLEVSSFQLEIAGDFSPGIALLLNFTADHLDRHHSMAEYLKAKLHIFANQKPGDVAILGGDDPLVADIEVKTNTRLLFGAGKNMQASIHDSSVEIKVQHESNAEIEKYPLAETVLNTSINRLNAAAAILAARSFGAKQTPLRKGLLNYPLPPNRMELVDTINGVFYVNDTKATNIGSMTAAISSVEGPVILIAGGRDKGCDFNKLPAAGGKIKKALLIGEASGKLLKIFQPVTPATTADSLISAVQMADTVAVPGDTVLLAPGCASFDMFTDYVHRGEVFKQAVAGLRIEKTAK